jgi:FMN phosphatase YigB (HAD superfamily)
MGFKEMTMKAIAFDWGGIFTENTFDSSAVKNLSVLCHTTPEVIAKTYFPLMEEFEAGAFDFDTFYLKFVQHSSLELDSGMFRKTFLGSVKERSAMFEVLNAIPQGIVVGMLSNNVPVLCDRVRTDVRFSRVDHFVFSNEIKVRKPDAKAFDYLTQALGVSARDTVFIDDNQDNIAACEALGFTGLYLDTFEGFVTRWQQALPGIALQVSA